MKALDLALLNLIRRRVPTLIAVIAIAISVACSGVLLRLHFVSSSRFESMTKGGDAIVGAKAGGIEILLGSLNAEGRYPDFVPHKLFESLRREQAVQFEDGSTSQPSYIRSVIPFVYFGRTENSRLIGTDESFLNRPNRDDSLTLKEGRWASGPREVVVGSRVAQKRKLKLEDSIDVTPWFRDEAVSTGAISFKVVGILNESNSVWDRSLYSNLNQAYEIFSQVGLGDRSIWGPQVLHYFLIYLKPGGLSPLKSLVNNRTVGQIISVPEEKNALEKLTGSGRALGLIVSSFILFLGALSAAGILVTRFESMSVQIAMLRAIGFEKRKIAAWLSWEGFLLGSTACVLGAVLDAISFPLLRNLLGSALPPPEVVESHLYLSSPIWLVAILATMLAVFIPLARIYRQDIHSSLKGL